MRGDHGQPLFWKDLQKEDGKDAGRIPETKERTVTDHRSGNAVLLQQMAQHGSKITLYAFGIGTESVCILKIKLCIFKRAAGKRG